MAALNPNIPLTAFEDGGGQRRGSSVMSTLGDMMKLEQARQQIEDYDRDRDDQAQVRRIIAASNGDAESAITNLKKSGFVRQATEWEDKLLDQRKKNADILKAKLDREDTLLGMGRQIAQGVLENPTAEGWMTGRQRMDALGDPAITAAVFGDQYDPATIQARMQQAVAMGTTATEFNRQKREGIEDALSGKWDLAVARWLSTAQSQEEWDGILNSFKEQGAPGAILQRVPKEWSPAAAQQMFDITMTPNERADNAIQSRNADTSAKNAETSAMNAETARINANKPRTESSSGSSGPNETTRRAAENWRATEYARLAAATRSGDWKPTPEERAAEHRRIEEHYKNILGGSASAPTPREVGGGTGTLGQMMGGDVTVSPVTTVSTFQGQKISGAPSPGGLHRADMTRVTEPATTARGGSATAPPPPGRPSDIGEVAAAAGGSPNSAPAAPTTTGRPLVPPSAAMGSRAAWLTGDTPDPPAPKQDIPLGNDEGALTPLDLKKDVQAVRDRVRRVLQGLKDPKTGKPIVVDDENIDLFLSKPANLKRLNISGGR